MTPVTEQRLLLLIDNFLNRVASALERASNAYVSSVRASFPREPAPRKRWKA